MDETPKILLRLPRDVKQWLIQQAEYNLSSQNSKIVRALRAQMKAANRVANRAGTAA